MNDNKIFDLMRPTSMVDERPPIDPRMVNALTFLYLPTYLRIGTNYYDIKNSQKIEVIVRTSVREICYSVFFGFYNHRETFCIDSLLDRTIKENFKNYYKKQKLRKTGGLWP